MPPPDSRFSESDEPQILAGSKRVIAPRQRFKKYEQALAGGCIPTTTVAVSIRMGRVPQQSTSAELRVRRVATKMGWRYRIANRDLPGSPDLANRARKWVVFVHGCYWHHHTGCPKASIPRNNREFWLAKFSANQQRDSIALSKLRNMGFHVITIWECESLDNSQIRQALQGLRRQQ